MWRPTMSLLCLIAALAGAPLRQAEAAGDLARSLAERDGGDLVEEVDGGVGDDSGETILESGGPSRSLSVSCAPAPGDGPRMMLPPVAALSPQGGSAGPPDPPGGPISHHLRRRAWLQCLLF